jgi:hypothetical protein
MPLRPRVPALLAALLFAATLTAAIPAVTPPASAAPADDGTTSAPRASVARTPAEDRAVRDFWTPERRAAATPVAVQAVSRPAEPVTVRPIAARTTAGDEPEPAQETGQRVIQAVPPTQRAVADVADPPDQEGVTPVEWPDSSTGYQFPPGKSLPRRRPRRSARSISSMPAASPASAPRR